MLTLYPEEWLLSCFKCLLAVMRCSPLIDFGSWPGAKHHPPPPPPPPLSSVRTTDLINSPLWLCPIPAFFLQRKYHLFSVHFQSSLITSSALRHHFAAINQNCCEGRFCLARGAFPSLRRFCLSHAVAPPLRRVWRSCAAVSGSAIHHSLPSGLTRPGAVRTRATG